MQRRVALRDRAGRRAVSVTTAIFPIHQAEQRGGLLNSTVPRMSRRMLADTYTYILQSVALRETEPCGEINRSIQIDIYTSANGPTDRPTDRSIVLQNGRKYFLVQTATSDKAETIAPFNKTHNVVKKKQR